MNPTYKEINTPTNVLATLENTAEIALENLFSFLDNRENRNVLRNMFVIQ